MSKSEGTKKTAKNKAVALRYRAHEDMAPVVIASGYGTIADKIIGIAEEKGIPVFKDDSATSMLCMLEVGRNIPPELYEVIAAIYLQILKVSADIKHTAKPDEQASVRAEDIRQRLATGRRSAKDRPQPPAASSKAHTPPQGDEIPPPEPPSPAPTGEGASPLLGAETPE